jgi:hypothetical protein
MLAPLTNSALFSAPVTDHGHRHERPHHSRSHSRSPVTRGHLHSHLGASSSSRGRSTSPHRCSPLTPTNVSPISKRVASRSASPAQPCKHPKVVQWYDGKAPTGCPKACDYEDAIYPLIIKACHDYEARIGGLNMWPKLDEQITWAQDAWKTACAVVKEEYELTDRMLGLVSFSTTSYVRVLTPSRSVNGAPALVENSSMESNRKSQQLTGLFTVTIWWSQEALH